MTPYVVDTNVAIAANGKSTHADLQCQLACVEKLEDVCGQQVVAVDDGGLIFDEYKGSLHFAGATGVGDKFLQACFRSWVRQKPRASSFDYAKQR